MCIHIYIYICIYILSRAHVSPNKLKRDLQTPRRPIKGTHTLKQRHTSVVARLALSFFPCIFQKRPTNSRETNKRDPYTQKETHLSSCTVGLVFGPLHISKETYKLKRDLQKGPIHSKRHTSVVARSALSLVPRARAAFSPPPPQTRLCVHIYRYA